MRNRLTTPTTCPIHTDVGQAAAIIANDGLVAFATETVYGLGANAFSPWAVARIFEVKNRPRFDPLIVHIADQSWLSRLVTEVPPAAQELADHFWPGPLTLVLPKTGAVPDIVTAGLPTVAVRIPDHPQALELLHTANLPIAAPSANPFGQLSPTRAEHVAEQLGDHIDCILNGGPCRVGVESTVLGFRDNKPVLLRPGGITLEAIEQLVGPTQFPTPSDEAAPHAPGMLPSHYAPRTPLQVAENPHDIPTGKRVGLLTLTSVANAESFAAIEVLSPTANLTEAAANFFTALRRLDTQSLELIVALPLPNTGLGRALNDRLQRAAHSSD